MRLVSPSIVPSSLHAIESFLAEHQIVISERFAHYQPKPGCRQAAVLIPLCRRHGETSLLYTVRSDKVRTHKGQVSFPGGHIETGESPFDAAIRETKEELGSDIGAIRILGMYPCLPAITGTPVYPVLAFLEMDVGDLSHFSPSSDEVKEVFTRSIEQLEDPSFKSYQLYERFGLEYLMPVYGEEKCPQKIWGLTAMITDATINKVLLPALAKS